MYVVSHILKAVNRWGGFDAYEENESFLSQILMEEVHPKYYLSQRACEGILRRAKKRGKKLPEILQKVLEKQAISA